MALHCPLPACLLVVPTAAPSPAGLWSCPTLHMKVTIDRFIEGSNLWGLGIAAVFFAVAVMGEMVTHYFQYYLTMSVAQKSLVY